MQRGEQEMRETIVDLERRLFAAAGGQAMPIDEVERIVSGEFLLVHKDQLQTGTFGGGKWFAPKTARGKGSVGKESPATIIKRAAKGPNVSAQGAQDIDAWVVSYEASLRRRLQLMSRMRALSGKVDAYRIAAAEALHRGHAADVAAVSNPRNAMSPGSGAGGGSYRLSAGKTSSVVRGADSVTSSTDQRVEEMEREFVQIVREGEGETVAGQIDRAFILAVRVWASKVAAVLHHDVVFSPTKGTLSYLSKGSPPYLHAAGEVPPQIQALLSPRSPGSMLLNRNIQA
mmetsp:Transcript_23756/g.51536  ORF Transcript_23756/g.51536 Transcript_23756/m.51536 type:complete len:287 (+) Transcript_23756:592-1452(+)